MKRQYSRVYPLSTYRDPNYESDSSFENYYLTYAEEEYEEQEKSTSAGGAGCDVGMIVNGRKDERENIDLERSKKKKTKKDDDDDDDVEKRGSSRVRSPDQVRRVLKLKVMRKDEGFSSRVDDNNSTSSSSACCSSQRIITSSTDDDHCYYEKENIVINNNNNGQDDEDEESMLFTCRVLQNADMNEQQHRLSLPCKQVVFNPFTTAELTTLSSKEPVHARLRDPRGVEYPIRIRFTKAGSKNYCYGIGKPWLQIKDDNRFQPGMVLDIRVASLRRGGQLCFSLHYNKNC